MPARLDCPICGQIDMVQKVSSVYASLSYDYGLKSQIRPPREPDGELTDLEISIFFFVYVLLIPALVSFLAWVIAGSEFGGPLAVAVVCLSLVISISILSFFVIPKRKKKKIAKEMPHWERAMRRWEGLYYCARDHGVFNPDERVFIPVSQLSQYLYQ